MARASQQKDERVEMEAYGDDLRRGHGTVGRKGDTSPPRRSGIHSDTTGHNHLEPKWLRREDEEEEEEEEETIF